MSHDPFRKRYGIILSIGNRESGKTTWAVKKLVKEAITKRHYRTFFANLHVGLKLDRKTGLHSGYPGVRYITYEDFMKIRSRRRRECPRPWSWWTRYTAGSTPAPPCPGTTSRPQTP